MDQSLESKDITKTALPQLGVVLMGDLGSGKSSTVGHLLYLNKEVSKEDLESNEKLALSLGFKEILKYAYVSSKLNAERKIKRSVETSKLKLVTENKIFTLYDLPGHVNYLNNTISGCALGNALILVVSAEEGEFKKGFDKRGQTKQHALYAFAMGISQIVVAVNKMDLIKYDEGKFNEIKDNIFEYLRKVGFQKDYIFFIPYSATIGDNLISKSDNTPWYKGPVFLEILNSLKIPKVDNKIPFRMIVQRVFKVSGVGTCVSGVVKYGTIKAGQTISISSKPLTSECNSIQKFQGGELDVVPGDNISINVKKISIRDVNRGDVIALFDDKTFNKKGVKSFIGTVIVLNHPKFLKSKTNAVVDFHCDQVTCTIVILSKYDRIKGEEIMKAPGQIENGDKATIEFTLLRSALIEPFDKFPALGRFSMRDNNEIIAVGIVNSVVPIN